MLKSEICYLIKILSNNYFPVSSLENEGISLKLQKIISTHPSTHTHTYTHTKNTQKDTNIHRNTDDAIYKL